MWRAVLALAIGAIRAAFRLSAATAFTGRFLRLSVLVAFAQTLQDWFGFPVERLPEWVRGWA